MNTKITLGVTGIVLALVAGYFIFFRSSSPEAQLDTTPKNVTLTGTYECLPHKDTSGPQTEECAFGIKTDDGDHYAVNFGASASAMQQFQSNARITAEGFIVIKEALSTDQWQKYDMKGIFTVTRMIDPAPTGSDAKLNINLVCEGALTYMTFPDSASADVFVAECKEGKHPEVIERYKADMNLDGATI